MIETQETNITPEQEAFLQSLPPSQREIVEFYAKSRGIKYTSAFNILMDIETEENISDRSR